MKAAVIYEHGGPGSIKYESNYPDPKPEAAAIRDRVAFWRGVQVSA